MQDDIPETNEAQPTDLERELADVQEAAEGVRNEMKSLQETLVERTNKLLDAQAENAELKAELAAAKSEIGRLQVTDQGQMSEELSRMYAALGVDPTEPIDAIRDRLHALGVPGY